LSPAYLRGIETERGGEVFRAHLSNVLDIWGYRHGRWECSKAHFERFKNLIIKEARQ
jgi:hypothetical protein